MTKVQSAEESEKYLLNVTGLSSIQLDYVVMEYLFHKGRIDHQYINKIMTNFVAGLNSLRDEECQGRADAETTAIAALHMIDKNRICLKKNAPWVSVIKRYLSNFKSVNLRGINEKFLK